MTNSPWGGTPEPDARSGRETYAPYGAWPDTAPVGAASYDQGGHGWADSYGEGAVHAQQHPHATLGAALPGGHTQVLPPVPGPEQAGPPEPIPGPRGAEPMPESAEGTPVTLETEPDPAPGPEPRKSRAGRNLPAAIGVGVGLIGLILVSLLTVQVLFVGLAAVAVLVGLWELSGALRGADAIPRETDGRAPQGAVPGSGITLPFVPLAVGTVAMLAAAYARGPDGLVIATALTALAVMMWRMTEGAPNFLRDMTAGVFTVFYLPFLAGFAVLMLADDLGAQRVLTFIILVVCADTGAYAAGVLLGRHKMAPTISPGKTWEGFGGALVTAAAGGALCVVLMLEGRWWQGAVIGVAAAAVSALGDLAESMIKRDLKVKDMGSLLPGHGGLMDRLDSLLAAAPVVWLLLAAFLGR